VLSEQGDDPQKRKKEKQGRECRPPFNLFKKASELESRKNLNTSLPMPHGIPLKGVLWTKTGRSHGDTRHGHTEEDAPKRKRAKSWAIGAGGARKRIGEKKSSSGSNASFILKKGERKEGAASRIPFRAEAKWRRASANGCGQHWYRTCFEREGERAGL